MELILLIVIAALAVISIVLSLAKGNNHAQAEQLQAALRQQMQENREELNRSIRELRMEMTQTLNQNMQQLQDVLHKNMMTNGELQRQKFDTMARQQEVLIKSTEKRLDDMRLMVEEKLQKTLNERIGQSFEIVRSQLENVQKGLGEMKSLAQDVGGLKKVLSNVKMRGTFGEVQLGALLEQMMSPEQYDANVKTKKSGTEFVEFAIKLPGKDDANSTVYLPIDAKFPKDVYEQYYDAFEAGDTALIESSGKQLETTIKKMAKDIHDKYVDPPFTTDFAIMFLPFESIYAEVIRRTSLVETLQKDYKIVVTGPTTLGAILNSLQMGFRTLAIQKRTGEVWTVLGADEYITKPFDASILKIRVDNLIQSREKLKELYSKNFSLESLGVDVTSVDEKFMQKLYATLQQNIANSDLNLDAFCKELGLSKSNLYRKIKQITGYSPNEFIRNFRLETAAKMLKETDMSITEVYCAVGYNSLAYFSNSFKTLYGVSPSEFKNRSEGERE